jgi:ADP-ribose diphosphatase
LKSRQSFSTLSTTDVMDLGFLRVQTRTIATPSGTEVERIVIAHPGAVAVVPLIDDDVILIEQYRAAVEDVVLEIPAGKIDGPEHDRRAEARRELAEETGFIARTLEPLTELWTAVGFSDERITIFLADDVTHGTRSPVGSEEEEARIVRMPLEAAVDMVMRGEITDAKTVAGLLMTAVRRGSA